MTKNYISLSSCYQIALQSYGTRYSQINQAPNKHVNVDKLEKEKQFFYNLVSSLSDPDQPMILNLMDIDLSVSQIFFYQYTFSHVLASMEGKDFGPEELYFLYKCGYAAGYLEHYQPKSRKDGSAKFTAQYINDYLAKDFIDDFAGTENSMLRQTLEDIVKFSYHDAQMGVLANNLPPNQQALTMN